jgi:hypothetical protein
LEPAWLGSAPPSNKSRAAIRWPCAAASHSGVEGDTFKRFSMQPGVEASLSDLVRLNSRVYVHSLTSIKNKRMNRCGAMMGRPLLEQIQHVVFDRLVPLTGA